MYCFLRSAQALVYFTPSTVGILALYIQILMRLCTYRGKDNNYRVTLLTFVEDFFPIVGNVLFSMFGTSCRAFYTLLHTSRSTSVVHTNNVDSVDTVLISTWTKNHAKIFSSAVVPLCMRSRELYVDTLSSPVQCFTLSPWVLPPVVWQSSLVTTAVITLQR